MCWFSRLIEQGVFFVTRTKAGVSLRVVETRPVVEKGMVVADEMVEIASEEGRRNCPHPLRRIIVVREDTLEPFEVLTCHMTLAASTVAAIYKDRWQVELFFKAIKQNLKIKTLVGTTPNGLKTQIWTALIAMLVIKLQVSASFAWSLSNLVAILRMNL